MFDDRQEIPTKNYTTLHNIIMYKLTVYIITITNWYLSIRFWKKGLGIVVNKCQK